MLTLDPTRPLIVFGGPYSNLEATDALFAEADRLGVPLSHVICTGDVVAYAGDPEATSNRIRKSHVPIIAGNCEEQLANAAADCGCGFDEGSACDVLSKRWFAFADRSVSEATRAWMRELPQDLWLSYAGRTFRVVHATSTSNNQFVFASETRSVASAYQACQSEFVLAGHSGIPFVAKHGTGAWINAGVIGVPANDGTKDGWYAVISARDGDIEVAIKRLRYDAAAAAETMRMHGHANPYADALLTGHWPSLDVLPDAERAASGVPIDEQCFVFPTATESGVEHLTISEATAKRSA